MAVSVEQAAANALGRWLASQLPPAEVTVDTRWPEASVDVPAKAVESPQAATELCLQTIDRAAEAHELLAQTSVGDAFDVLPRDPIDGFF